MEYGIIGILVLIADIYAVVKTLQSGAGTGEKLLWILGIIVFPVVGFLVWLLAGPKGSRGVTV
jgi:hypothetical protein